MADQQFCLRWNNHQSTLISVFDTLLENGTLVDCTLAAEGQYLKAHKVVLCACSPYLETLLSQHYEKHPIVILKDVKFSELKSMMDYMYRGEVNISQDQLGTFLKAAESLQIKGLSDNGADGDARDVGSTPKAPPPRKATQPAPSSRPEPARPDSPLTDGSMSPSSRKRRRVRRSSQDDGDSHLDSNSCDLPSQAQSTPVPNIPVATSSITTTPIVKPAIVKPEQTDINRIDSNSLPPEALKKEIEPISEPLLEPKTEYLEDMNNEDSVEDLTLDDDDDMEGMDISNMSNMSNMSRPGPSHGNDVSNQGFAPWQLGANQSGTDEVFMAAQEAVNQHRDSQGLPTINAKGTKASYKHFEEKDIGNKLISRNEASDVVPRTEGLTMPRKSGDLDTDMETVAIENIPVKQSGEKAAVEIINVDDKGEETDNSILQKASHAEEDLSEQIKELIEGNLGESSKSVKTTCTFLGKSLDNLGNIQEQEDVPLHLRLESALDEEEIKLKTSYDLPKIPKTSKRRNQKAPKKLVKSGMKVESTVAPGIFNASTSEIGENSKQSTANIDPTLNPNYLGHDNDYEFDDDEEKFKCKRCNKFFKTKGSLLGHQRYICGKDPNHTCPFCRYKARSAISVRVHVGRKHNCWPRLNQDHKWIY